MLSALNAMFLIHYIYSYNTTGINGFMPGIDSPSLLAATGDDGPQITYEYIERKKQKRNSIFMKILLV